MTSSSNLGVNRVPVLQMLIAGSLVATANAYYWFIVGTALVPASSINLATIAALVFLLPIKNWPFTLPTIAISNFIAGLIFAPAGASLVLDIVVLGGGFSVGYIGKLITKLWSPSDFSGQFITYLPSALPVAVAYFISLLMLHVLRYGNDFMSHFTTLDDVLFHLHLLEFSILGIVMFTFLQAYRQRQEFLSQWQKKVVEALAASIIHLSIIYLFPGNYWLVVVSLLVIAYFTGSFGCTVATTIAATLAPYAWGQNGTPVIALNDFTLYALIVFVIVSLALIRDGFVSAAKQGRPFTLSLTPSGRVGLTMASPEVDALRLQLEQKSLEISTANSDLEKKNAKLFNLTKSLELQKQTYKHLVEIDELTNLKSRRFFSNQMADGVRNLEFCILMIDLDNFKSVNDIYGHHAGDLLLKACARVLHQACDERSFAARLGGEEFCIALQSNDLEEAIKFANNIRQLVAKTTINLHNVEITRSISIGLARLDTQSLLKDVMSQADAALYDAKEAGKNCIRVADHAFIENWSQARSAPKLDAIIQGLENNEFVYYLQPICNIDSGDIVGFEALMRWERADGSVLAPKEFIETVLSRPVYALFKKASKKQILPILQQLHELDESFYLSINADSTFFHTPRYVTDIVNQLRQAGADIEKLIIELPETAEIHDQQLVVNNVNYLRENGIRIALDDFGMEHSNMDRIRDIPADFVKIDRSFIIDLQNDPRSIAIVRALVTMSHELNFDIIAEGIEEQEQADALIEAGVKHVQGYYYGQPKPLNYWKHAHKRKHPS